MFASSALKYTFQTPGDFRFCATAKLQLLAPDLVSFHSILFLGRKTEPQKLAHHKFRLRSNSIRELLLEFYLDFYFPHSEAVNKIVILIQRNKTTVSTLSDV